MDFGTCAMVIATSLATIDFSLQNRRQRPAILGQAAGEFGGQDDVNLVPRLSSHSCNMAVECSQGRLAGKIALVTAAAQGIGRATAIEFAKEGARVIATDINEEKLAELGSISGIETRRLDVTDREAIERLAGDLDKVDILFNCAGIVQTNTILSCSEQDWDLTFNVNIKSMFWTCKYFLPKMIAQGSGSVVNVGSVASNLLGVSNRCAYGVSKAAVAGLTKSIAADFITKGVRCNCICPARIQSPSLCERLNSQPDPKKARQEFLAQQKLGRFGKAEEVAKLAVYLASDESGFTTGQEHIIDGGMMLP